LSKLGDCSTQLRCEVGGHVGLQIVHVDPPAMFSGLPGGDDGLTGMMLAARALLGAARGRQRVPQSGSPSGVVVHHDASAGGDQNLSRPPFAGWHPHMPDLKVTGSGEAQRCPSRGRDLSPGGHPAEVIPNRCRDSHRIGLRQGLQHDLLPPPESGHPPTIAEDRHNCTHLVMPAHRCGDVRDRR
jgi:hypothetical protein